MPNFHEACDPAEIEALARKVWGEPNRALTTRDELRFGTNGSKSVKPRLGVWFDHEVVEGGHYRDLYRLVNGTYPENGSDKSGFQIPSGMLRDLGNPIAWWDYHDEHGYVVARVVRFQPAGADKTFRQCRPEGDRWSWKMGGIQIPLYRLPSLVRAPAGSLVYVTEGEKHADRLREWGLIATTNAGGAGKFRTHHASTLVGYTAIVLGDNDEAGRKHVAATMAALRQAGVTAYALALPGLPKKGDVIDWIAAGGTREALEALTADILARDEKKPAPERSEARQERPEPAADHEPPLLPMIWMTDIKPILTARDYVQGVLIEKALTVVYGDSHAGKTFWTTDLALHVAAGKRWNGRRVDQGGVLYCVLEGGDGFMNRVSAWKDANPEVGSPPFAAIAMSLNLLNPDADTSILIDTIKAVPKRSGFKVKTVVVDTLSRALTGGNENSPEDMGALVINADRIRAETGATLIFVHHSGKDAAKGARGHSLLRAAVDTEIEVVSDDVTGVRTATVVKQRDIAKSDPISFRLDVVTLGQNQHGEDVTTCIVSPAAAPIVGFRSETKLADKPAILLRTLRNLDPALFDDIHPEPEMLLCKAVRRSKLRSKLIADGWFPENMVIDEGLSGIKLVKPGFAMENNALTPLKRKGFINFNREWIWLI